MVPHLYRHELSGVVTEVGSKVEKVKVGDKVGVGVFVGSCRQCEQCTNDLESYCPKQVLTYGATYFDGTMTYGGYSDIMVADEHFVIRWPDNLPLDVGAPLLCAGITVYSPLRYFGLDKPGLNIGVVGLGGLGHLAVKFAKAFGSKVTVISTSVSKKKEAIEQLGVDEFVISSDPQQMQVKLLHTKIMLQMWREMQLSCCSLFGRVWQESWMVSSIRCLRIMRWCHY